MKLLSCLSPLNHALLLCLQEHEWDLFLLKVKPSGLLQEHPHCVQTPDCYSALGTRPELVSSTKPQSEVTQCSAQLYHSTDPPTCHHCNKLTLGSPGFHYTDTMVQVLLQGDKNGSRHYHSQRTPDRSSNSVCKY